ncbi:hypothetical protein HFP72_00755 [Nocardiopsis sp. ARC36]
MPGPGADTPGALAGSGAVRLFTARAEAAVAGFALDADTAPAVATVCRRLDGIPSRSNWPPPGCATCGPPTSPPAWTTASRSWGWAAATRPPGSAPCGR